MEAFRRPSFDLVGIASLRRRGAKCSGKNRSKNGSGNHQHEDHIEQSAIDEALTAGLRVSKATNVAASVAATCGNVSDHIVRRATGE